MNDKTISWEPGRNFYQYIQREEFTVDGTRLVVEDRMNNFLPWCSERLLWIAGTDAYYSAAPLCPAIHRLLCFTYCKDAMEMHAPDFYQHVLVLGCGGGAVPRWLLEEFPSLHVDVVDRSPEIIAICKKYFLYEWEDCDRLQYHCIDARDYEPPAYQYQFIFCDLFDGRELAPVVYDKNFAGKLRSMVCDEGMLIINCGWHHLEDVKQTYQPEFAYLKVLDRDLGQTEVIKMSNSAF